jgi:hypothetical protein
LASLICRFTRFDISRKAAKPQREKNNTKNFASLRDVFVLENISTIFWFLRRIPLFSLDALARVVFCGESEKHDGYQQHEQKGVILQW